MGRNKVFKYLFNTLNSDQSLFLEKCLRCIHYVKFRIKKYIFQRICNVSTQNDNLVEEILASHYLINSCMVTEYELRIILNNLKNVLDSNVEGDVVELGCNVGTTSVFIERLLQEYVPRRKLHVYDSFEGLPEKSLQDESSVTSGFIFEKGSCKTRRELFIFNFKILSLKLPKMHIGWFGEISDHEYPQKIAFAFFDGDFYTSITDSFTKVYPKLSSGSCVAIHDYGNKKLPGVEAACNDFLANKSEEGTILRFENLGILVIK